MASATAALRHLRLKVGATSNSPSSSSSFPSPYSGKLFLYPTPHTKSGLFRSCSALSLHIGPHSRLGLSYLHYPFAREKKGRDRRNLVVASLFGVGAPEALVIGVVALLVFGPKGLAEVARNLGKTLRAFQPTIRELQDVSREFKNTLEREIGLDEVESSSPTNYNSAATGTTADQSSFLDPNGKPTNGAYSSEDLLKVTEEQLAASASASTVDAPVPAPTTDNQGPEDASVSSASSEEATPVDATLVEVAAVATSTESSPSISESSSETKSSEKTSE